MILTVSTLHDTEINKTSSNQQINKIKNLRISEQKRTCFIQISLHFFLFTFCTNYFSKNEKGIWKNATPKKKNVMWPQYTNE